MAGPRASNMLRRMREVRFEKKYEKGQIPLKNANLGGRGPQRIMAQLENGFPREYGVKLSLVRLLELEKGFRMIIISIILIMIIRITRVPSCKLHER